MFFIVVICILITAITLICRLSYLMTFKSQEYVNRARNLHERERPIKATRGLIYDRNEYIATNKPVYYLRNL